MFPTQSAQCILATDFARGGRGNKKGDPDWFNEQRGYIESDISEMGKTCKTLQRLIAGALQPALCDCLSVSFLGGAGAMGGGLHEEKPTSKFTVYSDV